MSEHPNANVNAPTSVSTLRMNRRTLAARGASLAGAAFAVPAFLKYGRAASAQDPAAWTEDASIVSWGYNNEATNPLAAARIEAFNQAYPSISLELVPELDQQKILTAAVSDSLPDLLWLDRFSIASYAARGSVIMPIDEFVERDSYDISRFYPAGIEESTYDGQLYGIPGGMDVQALYVNLDALAEVGIADISELDTGNWEQMLELGEMLVQRDGDVVERWGFDHKTQDGFQYVWGLANGGQFMSGDDPTFDDPAIVEAIEWSKAVSDAQGGFQLYDAARTSWQGDEQFARGQVAMTMYQSWMLGIITRTVPELNFAVVPVRPRGASEGSISVAGGRSWCISAGANDPEAAWEFIKFMHTDETWLIGAQAVLAARQAEGQPYVPSLTGSESADLAQIEQVYEPIDPKFDDAIRLFPEILATASVRPVASSPVSTELDTILSQTGVLPALRGERAVDEAMESAQSEAENAAEEFR